MDHEQSCTLLDSEDELSIADGLRADLRARMRGCLEGSSFSTVVEWIVLGLMRLELDGHDLVGSVRSLIGRAVVLGKERSVNLLPRLIDGLGIRFALR